MTRASQVCLGLLAVLGLSHGLRGLHRQKVRQEQRLHNSLKEETSAYPEQWHSQILDHFDATNSEYKISLKYDTTIRSFH